MWTFERLKSDGPTADLFAPVESIAPGEGHSVVFTLSAPNPDFLYNLTDNHAVILQADAANLGDEFNGTGPFALSDYIADDRAIFTTNADYFGGAPAIAQLPAYLRRSFPRPDCAWLVVIVLACTSQELKASGMPVVLLHLITT